MKYHHRTNYKPQDYRISRRHDFRAVEQVVHCHMTTNKRYCQSIPIDNLTRMFPLAYEKVTLGLHIFCDSESETLFASVILELDLKSLSFIYLFIYLYKIKFYKGVM